MYGSDDAPAEAARAVLLEVLEGSLRLLHPTMPFVTEELWQYLTGTPYVADRDYGPALIVAPYPEAEVAALDEQAEADFALVMDIVRVVRNARAERKVEPGRWIGAIIAGGQHTAILRAQAEVISQLARVDADHLTFTEYLAERPLQAVALVVGEVEVFLPLAELVDIDAERVRLQEALHEAEGEIARAAGKLANVNFVTKAPPEVVDKERQRQALAEEEARRLGVRLEELG